MERQFGAYVTADTEEQWIDATLPLGATLAMEDIVDLQELVPDCGYQLRWVEVTALGRIEEVECDDCESGRSHELVVRGGGTRLELTRVDKTRGAEGQVGEALITAALMPPFEGHLQLRLTSVLPEGP